MDIIQSNINIHLNTQSASPRSSVGRGGARDPTIADTDPQQTHVGLTLAIGSVLARRSPHVGVRTTSIHSFGLSFCAIRSVLRSRHLRSWSALSALLFSKSLIACHRWSIAGHPPHSSHSQPTTFLADLKLRNHTTSSPTLREHRVLVCAIINPPPMLLTDTRTTLLQSTPETQSASCPTSLPFRPAGGPGISISIPSTWVISWLIVGPIEVGVSNAQGSTNGNERACRMQGRDVVIMMMMMKYLWTTPRHTTPHHTKQRCPRRLRRTNGSFAADGTGRNLKHCVINR
jgi:hypothetical protein